MLDRDEWIRWWATALDRRAVARQLLDGSHHPAAVLHAEQAAQCALKGLLHGVGDPALLDEAGAAADGTGPADGSTWTSRARGTCCEGGVSCASSGCATRGAGRGR